MGRIQSLEERKKRSLSRLGMKFSEEHRKNLSKSQNKVFWHDKPASIARDAKKDEWAKMNGYDLLRIKYSELKNNIFIKKIENKLIGVYV